MKKSFIYYLSSLLMVGACSLSLSSCSNDELGETIFPDVDDTFDPSSTTYKFDKWLHQNYLQPYNLQFIYKMKDISTNMNYNVVPASYQNAIDVAVLAKYLWFDVYTDPAIVGDGIKFLKENSPRVIHLIGSPSYKSDGTILMGLAEGGVKISLYAINDMDVNDIESMNELCFKTMHHEFTHILHQKKTYPSAFNLISNGHYDDTNWGNRNSGEVRSLGFVTTYASSQHREDYAEITANYIVKSDEEWAMILDDAGRGWEKETLTGNFYCYYYYKDNVAGDENKAYAAKNEVTAYTTPDGDSIKVLCDSRTKALKFSSAEYMGTAPYTQQDDGSYRDAKDRVVDQYGYLLDASGYRMRIPLQIYDVADTDGIDGREAILKKLAIVRQWFADDWKIDLDKLHRAVIEREHNYDIVKLRKQIEDME